MHGRAGARDSIRCDRSLGSQPPESASDGWSWQTGYRVVRPTILRDPMDALQSFPDRECRGPGRILGP
jgi:hypothetical protein